MAITGLPFSFNNYQFDILFDKNDGYICEEWAIKPASRISTQLVPRSDVGTQQDAGRSSTIHNIKVGVYGSTLANFRSYLHQLIANSAGIIGGALFKNDDKYWFATLKNWSYVHTPDQISLWTTIDLEFECADPFLYYASGPVTTFFQSGSAFGSVTSASANITNPGEVYAGYGIIGPVWTLHGPLPTGVTIVNATTNPTQNMSYNAVLGSGHTLVVDVGRRIVTLDGAETYTNFTGDSFSNGFVTLNGNASGAGLVNSIQINAGGSSLVGGNISMAFTPRDVGVD